MKTRAATPFIIEVESTAEGLALMAVLQNYLTPDNRTYQTNRYALAHVLEQALRNHFHAEVVIEEV